MMLNPPREAEAPHGARWTLSKTIAAAQEETIEETPRKDREGQGRYQMSLRSLGVKACDLHDLTRRVSTGFVPRMFLRPPFGDAGYGRIGRHS